MHSPNNSTGRPGKKAAHDTVAAQGFCAPVHRASLRRPLKMRVRTLVDGYAAMRPKRDCPLHLWLAHGALNANSGVTPLVVCNRFVRGAMVTTSAGFMRVTPHSSATDDIKINKSLRFYLASHGLPLWSLSPPGHSCWVTRAMVALNQASYKECLTFRSISVS
jgi:hypothetical protein